MAGQDTWLEEGSLILVQLWSSGAMRNGGGHEDRGCRWLLSFLEAPEEELGARF